MGGKTLDTLFFPLLIYFFYLTSGYHKFTEKCRGHDLSVFVTSYNPKSRSFWTWKMMIFNILMTLVAHCVTILSSDKRSG